MKKKVAVIMVFLLLFSFSIVQAKEKLNSKNKIEADSPLYFLDKTAERINYFFANDEKKVKLKFSYAHERLIESKEMLEKEKTDKAKELFKEAVNNFSEGIKLATKKTINNKELKEIKEELKKAIQEVRKLLAEENVEELKNTITDLFNN